MNTIKVNNYELPVREYQGQRVVTFRDIDGVHSRPEGTARKRFNDNRKHFISGTDFFNTDQASEIRALGITRPQGGTPEHITLITESGYLMLVKSFTDDLAWEVQRQLVNGYFRAQVMFVPQPIHPEHAAGVANLIRAVDAPLKSRNATPLERCHQAKLIMEQCGVAVISTYDKLCIWDSQQLTLEAAPPSLQIAHVDNMTVENK